MKTETNTSLHLQAAVRGSVQMVGHLNRGARSNPAAMYRCFADVYDALAALPGLLPEEFLHNFACWPCMWSQGEYKAARWQFVQLIRKLRGFIPDWQDLDLVSELSTVT